MPAINQLNIIYAGKNLRRLFLDVSVNIVDAPPRGHSDVHEKLEDAIITSMTVASLKEVFFREHYVTVDRNHLVLWRLVFSRLKSAARRGAALRAPWS